MRGGIPGIMSVSWTDYGLEDNSTVIYGAKGTMKIFASELDDIVVDLRDGTSARHHVSPMSTNANQLSSGIIDAFVETILRGGEPPVTGLDGRNTLACLEAAKKILRGGHLGQGGSGLSKSGAYPGGDMRRWLFKKTVIQ